MWREEKCQQNKASIFDLPNLVLDSYCYLIVYLTGPRTHCDHSLSHPLCHHEAPYSISVDSPYFTAWPTNPPQRQGGPVQGYPQSSLVTRTRGIVNTDAPVSMQHLRLRKNLSLCLGLWIEELWNYYIKHCLELVSVSGVPHFYPARLLILNEWINKNDFSP